jgi:hypothetical protein
MEGGKGGNSRKWQRCGEGYQEIRRIRKESEILKGTVITRVELLNGTKEIMENPDSRKYGHRRICLAMWGMACSYHSV